MALLDLLVPAILVLVVIIIAAIIVMIFNTLIIARNRVKNAWSQIDVQLKKRADLIPNLVETVKGYMKYEKSVLTEVTQARTAFMNAGNVQEKAKASNMITGALKSLFAVAENYPKLQASTNFMQLQEELSGVEGKIAYSRQFYNDSVLDYNNKIQVFPNNLLSSIMGFKQEQYFEVEEAERKPVKVSFE